MASVIHILVYKEIRANAPTVLGRPNKDFVHTRERTLLHELKNDLFAVCIASFQQFKLHAMNTEIKVQNIWSK